MSFKYRIHLSIAPILLHKLLLTLFIILVISPCFAAYFENLSIEEGLSQGSILDIVQDRYGFIWLGTADGLNRYDGIKFIHFKDAANDPNAKTVLTGLRIQKIVPDKDGNLWISTRSGLNYLNITTYEIKHYIHDPQNPHSLPNNALDALVIDSKGKLWIATAIGLARFDPNAEQFKLFTDDTGTTAQYQCSRFVRALTIDTNDNIWTGNRNNLCKFNPNTELFTLIDYRNNLQKSTSTHINELLYHSNGHLWLATRKGLYQYQPQSGQSTKFLHKPSDRQSLPDNWVSNLKESDSDHLWVGTSNGLGLLNILKGTFTNYQTNENNKNGLSNNQIFAINIDKSGLVLIGTNGGGLNIYNPRQQAFKHIKKDSKTGYSLSDLTAWGMVNAYGYVWIGTSNGLNRYDAKSGRIQQYFHDPNNPNSLPNQNVMTIVKGKNRDLWIVTWDGLSHFSIDNEHFENYIKDVDIPETYPLQNTVSIYYDKKRDQVWVGSLGQGISILNTKSKTFSVLKHDPSNNNSLRDDYAIFLTQIYDSIWIGTREGITRYYPDTEKFKHLMHDEIKIGKDCTAIKLLPNNHIAIASSNGLSIYDHENNTLIKHYTIRDGLADDYIYSLEIDKQGLIWVGTNSGLSRINLDTSIITNFNILDGLQGYEFNGTSSNNDGEYLYFGGYNGVNYFKPEDINTSDFIPPIAITGFSIHNKPLNNYLITKPINLSYKEDFFSIEFAALDFTHPKKNQYAYKLEGFDKNWIYSKNRNFASYTNLDGGDYTFRVKAANKYGIWNEQGVSLAIAIAPPFWETLWFRISAFIIILLSIFSVYALRVRTIQARNKMLEQRVHERTEDLENTLFELGETKDALIEAAHKAGMADTATAVLHNVGNLLNSVTTSAGLIQEAISSSVNSKFQKVNEMLISNKQNIIEYLDKDPKGKKLLEYLSILIETLSKENSALNENSVRLREKIESIKETITAQQRFAQGSGGFIEKLSLIDIVEESLLLQTGSIGRHEIKIERHYCNELPLISIQKAKLIQILINLYKNAKESMDACQSNDNILSIKISMDQDYAYIYFSDTGLGIEHDNLKKIFNHGYTTKEDCHGFGLHSCANYMVEMQGKMWAESNGNQQGATFILQFPLPTEEKSAA